MNNSLLQPDVIVQDFSNQNQMTQPQLTSNIQLTQEQLLDKKRHRRSKHEQEGRIHKCEYCINSYLSKPALNNHMNTKHSDILKQLNIEKRKRGRPRKYLVDANDNNNYEKTQYNPYFDEEKRKKNDNEINKENVVNVVFENIYKKYGKILKKNINEPKENPILSYLLEKRELNDKICDDIICKYLDFVLPLTNENYFIFILKFIILFRECINGIQVEKDSTKYGEKEFSTIESAEIFPEQCNEFFSNFLEKNHFFEFNEEERNELIEIIQHFCYWLFINSYTKSKLSLAS